ncbi:MAG TPA: PIN domain-containing protein, partial [Thermoanaerobaculia bacterium]
MILLDTSALIDALAGPRRSARRLRAAIDRGERILISTLVLYEWLRGARHERPDQKLVSRWITVRAPRFSPTPSGAPYQRG